MTGAEQGWLGDLLLGLGTLVLLGLPFWAVGIPVANLIQARRISGVLGPPADPVADDELQAALLTRRCAVRLWRDLLFGIFRFDQPTVSYPFARLMVLPGSLVLHLPNAGDHRFRSDASRAELTRRGFWLAWYSAGDRTERLRVYVLGRRRTIGAALRAAGWDV